MIRHEDVGVNLPSRLGASLVQCLDEPMPIHIILEDRLAPVAAIHQVVDRAGILDSQFARHDRKVTRAAPSVDIKNWPLYGLYEPPDCPARRRCAPWLNWAVDAAEPAEAAGDLIVL